MSSFFASLKDKAQAAVQSTNLPGGFGRTDSSDASQPSTSPSNAAAGGGGGIGGFMKTHGLEGIHHQLRSLQQQYSSSTTPVQKMITTAKGVAIDYDSVSRDTQSYSKELYLWGQTEPEDLKDVTDRLAWLSYVHGSLSGELAENIDASRLTFKHLRDAENAQLPRRNIRVGMQNQIAKIEHDQKKEQQQRLAEFKVQLQKNEEEDATAERDIEILKRKAVRDTEQAKWEAIREYAEKLSMVAQAALAIVPNLPPIPPSPAQPYHGEQETGSVRASLQKALDQYTPGNISLIVANPGPGDLKHTRSFGVTHAQELSRIGSEQAEKSHIPITPPPTSATAPPPSSIPSSGFVPPLTYASPPPSTSPLTRTVPIPLPGSPKASSATAPSPGQTSPPLNPANLNQAPAPIPIPYASTSPVVAPNPSDPTTKVPSVTPTVAETGVPKVAGPDGPGPSSGSLLDKKAPTSPVMSPLTVLPPPRFPTAEEEKQRLDRDERERLLRGEQPPAGSAAPPQFDSAEEEKKRLEREERERILASSSNPSGDHIQKPHGDDDGELPPYQEF